MSADNWAICPRCRAKEEERVTELRARATAAYGTLPVDEFDALRAESEKPIDTEALSTFREDYEIYGADDGQLVVVYSGKCQTCGLEHRFRHEDTFFEASA